LCEDATFAGCLRTLASEVQTRAALPAVPPTAQRVDMSDTLVCVAQRVGELADMTAPCSKSIGYGALLAALMLEFMLVI